MQRTTQDPQEESRPGLGARPAGAAPPKFLGEHPGDLPVRNARLATRPLPACRQETRLCGSPSQG